MRILMAVILGVSCGGAFAMPADQLQRLWSKAGFGPLMEQVPESSKAYDAFVDDWVDAAADHRVAAAPPPDWVDEPLLLPLIPKDLTPEQQRALRLQWARRYVELQAWWMQEMLTTSTPLTERMTLFWHGHFTSALKGVGALQLLYRQNLLLRRYALGNYRDLLHAIARDPAMLRYLNNQQNKKGAPNENFARELLELFTLGEGHYTETDVKQAARAFTGWRTRPPDQGFVVVAGQHDAGIKTFLGRTGPFDGDDVIDLILQQPRAAEFIVEQLWREFVSPQPDPAAVQRLAKGFRRDWEIAPLIKALLREPAFVLPANDGLLVKSPVEFVVGTLRAVDVRLSPLGAALAAGSMGQELFNPPNVKGWPGGEAWITSQWLLARRQFVLQLAGDAPPVPSMDAGNRTRLQRFADRELRRQSADVQRRFGEVAESLPPQGPEQRILVLAPVMPPVDGAKPPDRLETWLLDPVYNLK